VELVEFADGPDGIDPVDAVNVEPEGLVRREGFREELRKLFQGAFRTGAGRGILEWGAGWG